MIEIGNYNNLQFHREMDQGVYLVDPEDELLEEVLFPRKYVPENFREGDSIEVFVYVDSGNRPVATLEEPYAIIYEFAFLKVKTQNDFGAFLDWGVNKDLFVPFAEMEHPMKEGQSYVVFIDFDEKSNRLFASSKIYKNIVKEDIDIEIKDKVSYLVYEEIEQGYKVVIENLFQGLLYKNQLYKTITIGTKGEAYVNKIREDGKIDLTSEPYGSLKIEPSAQIVLDYLKQNEGKIDLTDKSSPEEIAKRLSMSKKTFKKALGNLYKQKLVRLEKEGTYLTS